MIVTLSALLFLFQATPPEGLPGDGTAWESVGAAASGERVAVARTTMRREGGKVLVWTKAEPASVGDDGVAATVRQWRFDCAARTGELDAFATYDQFGGILDANTISPAERRAEAVAAGTADEASLRAVC